MWDRLGQWGGVVVGAWVLAIAVAAPGCKRITETVVEKGVKAAKETTKGVTEGIDKGRKGGESVDDAFIVSKAAEVAGKGIIGVHAVRPRAENAKQAEVELALENTTDRPIRFTDIETLALDKENFVVRPESPPRELTVPPRAKERLLVVFNGEADKLAKVRLWGVDYPLPAVTASK
jgi:hypothetical protein